MKKKSILILVLSVLILAGGTALLLLRQSKSFVLVPIARGPIYESVYGLGTVVSAKVYRQNVGVGVIVREVYVHEGDFVKAGTLLLKHEGGITKAPFAGTVTALPYKEGELAAPPNAILTLTDLADLYVEVSLEQQGALRVAKGQKAFLSFESLRGQKLTGTVRAIFPKDGQFLIHIDVAKFPEGILPGMTTDVAIEVGRKENALVVPLAAISAGKLIVSRQGKKEKIAVKVGIVDGESAEILDTTFGPDDQIVLKKQ